MEGEKPFWQSKKFWVACLSLCLIAPGIYVGTDVLKLATLLVYGFISTLYLGGQGALDYYLRLARVVKPSPVEPEVTSDSLHPREEE